jgi:hypothetical protein
MATTIRNPQTWLPVPVASQPRNLPRGIGGRIATSAKEAGRMTLEVSRLSKGRIKAKMHRKAGRAQTGIAGV